MTTLRPLGAASTSASSGTSSRASASPAVSLRGVAAQLVDREQPTEDKVAVRDPEWAPDVVLSTLAVLEDGGVDGRTEIVTELLGGRWDGVAAMWLADRGHPEHGEGDPHRAIAGIVDLLSVTLGGDGPAARVAQLPAESSSSVLQDMWRLDHPRVADVLEAVGRHHPDKLTAKAARRSLAKWRSKAGSGNP